MTPETREDVLNERAQRLLRVLVQNYIREEDKRTPRGEWIVVPRTFPTRLLELQMPLPASVRTLPFGVPRTKFPAVQSKLIPARL